MFAIIWCLKGHSSRTHNITKQIPPCHNDALLRFIKWKVSSPVPWLWRLRSTCENNRNDLIRFPFPQSKSLEEGSERTSIPIIFIWVSAPGKWHKLQEGFDFQLMNILRRLRVVPILDLAKRERALKSPHARKARRGGEREKCSLVFLSHRRVSPFSRGVIFTCALPSLRKNGDYS